MKPKHQRMAWLAGSLLVLAVAVTLIVSAFRENLVFFYTPTQVVAGEAPKGQAFRMGGLVETGSVLRSTQTGEAAAVQVSFQVTDTAQTVPVRYAGVLPDLFREGKGVVVQGSLQPDGQFVATEVLAKHDENYMPPEAQHAVDQAQQTGKTLK